MWLQYGAPLDLELTVKPRNLHGNSLATFSASDRQIGFMKC
jgi:hypothetical protein